MDLIRSIGNFLQLFRFWVVVAPWEQALRVRLGKRVRLLRGGLHFKIPFLDVIYLQSVRMRLSTLEKQTVSTQDGKTVTLAGSIGYVIEDIGKLYDTLHHAEGTIASLAQVAITQYIATHDFDDCHPETIVAHLNTTLQFGQYGLGQAQAFLTNFAVVKTFRLIGDHGPYGGFGASLDTEKAHGESNGCPG